MSNTYNKYNQIRIMGYNILSYLIQNNNELFNLIYYNTPDALSLPYLTLEQKGNLIFNGTGDASQYRIFRQPFIDDSFQDQCTQLRIYVTNINPKNYILGTITFAIEVLTHVKLVNLDTYENRLEVMVQQILETINGLEDIQGVGRLFYDNSVQGVRNGTNLNIYNNRNYIGMTTLMSVHTGTIGSD